MAHRKAKTRSNASAQKGAVGRPAASAAPAMKAEAKPVPAASAPAAKVETKPATVAQAPMAKVEAKPAPAAVVSAAPVAKAIAADTNIIKTALTEGTKIMTNETIAKTNEALNKTVETGKIAADRMQAAFGDVNERTKVAVEKSSKLLEEATELTKGNVEALVASSKIAAKGVETLGQEAADFGRRSFEEASAALKSFAEVKSPTDFFRLQSEFAKTAFDNMVAESNKMSEAVIKLAGDVAQPLTNRYSVAAERVKSLAA